MRNGGILKVLAAEKSATNKDKKPLSRLLIVVGETMFIQ